jgi:hypothetical protein
MYTYINKKGKKYVLYWSEVKIKGGKKATVYYLLEENKQPSNSIFRSYRAEELPKTMEIKEIGVNFTPVVFKVRNGRD